MSRGPMSMAGYPPREVFAAVCISITLVATTYITLRGLYLIWFHPLSNVPGPKIAALTDLWKAHAVLRKRFYSALHKEHLKYGDVVRIGPNEVSIISPDDVQAVYGHKSEYLKGPFYDAWALVGRGHFSDRNPVTHARRRRSVASAYSLAHLITLERYCDSCTDLLFSRLDDASESGSVVDLSKFIEWYTFDSVSGIGLGKSFGLLENGGDTTGILTIIASASQVLPAMSTFTNWGWILPTKPVAWLTSTLLGDKGPNFFVKYGLRHVTARQKLRESDYGAYEETKDMLYRFMEAKDPETSKLLDTPVLVSNTISMIMAGADTTKASMAAFLRYVYAHPPTLERLRKEMDDAQTAGHLSFPVPYAQAARLEFMAACIKETMRLHPAVGMPLQRVVPAGGRTIGGRYYPAGTLIGMSPREIHLDERAYGKDASEWRPDRWLEGDRAELEKFSLVFGQGSRVCLGKNISLMEMFKLLPAIIYTYDITFRNRERPYKVCQSWFAIQSEFFCSVARREHTFR